MIAWLFWRGFIYKQCAVAFWSNSINNKLTYTEAATFGVHVIPAFLLDQFSQVHLRQVLILNFLSDL